MLLHMFFFFVSLRSRITVNSSVSSCFFLFRPNFHDFLHQWRFNLLLVLNLL